MITVAGLAPSLDLTYEVGELRLGRIHRPTRLVACAGGKPLNLARAAVRLGADATVVAVLGGPTGELLRTKLAADGVRVVAVATPAESRTCVSIASDDTGELTEVYAYAAPIPGDVWDAVLRALTETLAARPGWLAISGGPPQDLPVGALAEIVALGRASGARVAVDTHGPSLGPAVDGGVDLVKVNRHEAADLLGRPATDDLVATAHAVRARSGGVVVLTDAHDGAVATDGDTTWHAALPGVRGRFPVGSGDSFLAGLLTAYEDDADLPTALRLATAAGVANALVPGPGVLDDGVRAMAERVAIRRLGDRGRGTTRGDQP